MQFKNQYSPTDTDMLTLELNHFPGGVAIWGALPAVLDTTHEGFDRGVHVHARKGDSPKKVIDKTFATVDLVWKSERFLITEASSVSFTMSSIFDIEIIELICPACGHSHLDQGYDAVIPHTTHPCEHCGHIMQTDRPVVANELISLKHKIGDGTIQRPSTQPDRSIRLDPKIHKGGFQIWGSNPSIIWTANRLEESAIHVHAYAEDGSRIVDNTYSHVFVGDKKLDIEMIRVYQIQKALPNLSLTTIYCPSCQYAQFDQGIDAVRPTQKRTCYHCHTDFNSNLVVSNPADDLLKSLTQQLYAQTTNHEAA